MNEHFQLYQEPSGWECYRHRASRDGDVRYALDAFPQKPSSNDNQLWEFVPSSTSPGYFFIKSKLDGQVVDVKHANSDRGTFLQAYPRNAGETDNQLWKFVASDAYNYVFINVS